MKFSDSFIQELKDKNDISDLVSSYVSLKRKGRNLVGICPFHSEKTASFFVYPANGSFYCFGCAVGGDVINFIKLIENFDYIESVKYLAQRAGIPIVQTEQNDFEHKRKLVIYEINRSLAKFYHKCLMSDQGQKGLKYLKNRGLSLKTIRSFGLGYASGCGFSAVDYLTKKGYSADDLISSGVALRSQSGKIYDRFRDRVIFPIMDLRGNVIAFGGRAISGNMPKYLNTSDTPVFRKSDNVFALNFAKNKIDKHLILAEGYMDVISLHQVGFENTIATLGTALTESQVRLISRFTKEIVIAYDSDDAGKKASNRAIKLFRNQGVNVRVLNIPKGKDPDEFIKSYGKEGKTRFADLIKSSESDIEYRFDNIKSKYDLEKPSDKVKYLNDIVKVLCEITNFVEREVYASKLSNEIGIDKRTILMQVERVKKKQSKISQEKNFKRIQKDLFKRRDKLEKQNGLSLRAAMAEESFLSIIINNLDMVNNISDEFSQDLFISSLNRRIFEVVKQLNQEGRNINVTTISNEGFNEIETGYITKLICSYVPTNDIKNNIEKYISVMKEENEIVRLKDLKHIEDSEVKQYIENLKLIKK